MNKGRTPAAMWPAFAALVVAALLALLVTILVAPRRDRPPPPESDGPRSPAGRGPAVVAPPPASKVALAQQTLSGQSLPLGGETVAGVRTLVTLWSEPIDAEVDVEIKPEADPFDGAGLRSASGGDGGANIAHDLQPGPYKWRARARQGQHTTEWMVFDPAAEHFTVIAKKDASVDPPVDRADNGEGPGVAAPMASGAVGGKSDPRPSIVKPLAPLWTILMPIAAGLVVLGVLAGIALLWRHRTTNDR